MITCIINEKGFPTESGSLLSARNDPRHANHVRFIRLLERSIVWGMGAVLHIIIWFSLPSAGGICCGGGLDSVLQSPHARHGLQLKRTKVHGHHCWQYSRPGSKLVATLWGWKESKGICIPTTVDCRVLQQHRTGVTSGIVGHFHAVFVVGFAVATELNLQTVQFGLLIGPADLETPTRRVSLWQPQNTPGDLNRSITKYDSIVVDDVKCLPTQRMRGVSSRIGLLRENNRTKFVVKHYSYPQPQNLQSATRSTIHRLKCSTRSSWQSVDACRLLT